MKSTRRVDAPREEKVQSLGADRLGRNRKGDESRPPGGEGTALAKREGTSSEEERR